MATMGRPRRAKVAVRLVLRLLRRPRMTKGRRPRAAFWLIYTYGG